MFTVTVYHRKNENNNSQQTNNTSKNIDMCTHYTVTKRPN